MKILKRAAAAFILLACCILLTGCRMGEAFLFGMLIANGNDSVPKDEIFEYVKGHTDQLGSFQYELYEEVKADEKSRKQFIQNALGKDTIVKHVYRYSPEIVEFYCGGSGIVTSSTYCGFYYSKQDVPFALKFENVSQLKKTSEAVYEWESEDQRKTFYTERIQPNWFYYYMEWS